MTPSPHSGKRFAPSPIKLASEIINAVLSGRALSHALGAVPLARLSASDRGAAQDTCYGTLRYRGTLEAVLRQLLKKPLDDQPVHALLLAALYQLTYTAGAPYAIVDNAVNAAPERLKALTNAVLRNFLRGKEAFLEEAKLGVEGRTNFPKWWVEKLQATYPEQWEAILVASQQHPPMSLRVNCQKISPEGYLAALQSAGFPARQAGAFALTLEKPVPVEKLPGFAEGHVSVQDVGAQWAAQLLDAHDGMRVLDACAAPGGKTGHILEMAEAKMLALDVDALRLKRVKQNLDRLNLTAELKCGDAAMPKTWWDGVPFERILADVPCTASGVVRRNPDIKWLRQPSDIKKFTKQQAAILDTLWPMLAPGGKLLYVTCSLFAEENAHQIQAFLVRHADAIQLALPEVLGDGQLLPDENHDGFFYALLQRI